MIKTKFGIKNLLLFTLFFIFPCAASLNITQSTQENATLNTKLTTFELNEEKLFDIINRLAELKQVNILMPADQKKLSETTITFKLGKKISINEAWEMMLVMLDIAGYALIQRNNGLYEILSNTAIGKSIAPLYINEKPDSIKPTEATIRYLYYFQNIAITEKVAAEHITKILNDMLPGQKPDENFILNDKNQSLLITGKANNVKDIINIIIELDQGGFRETIEVIPILHTTTDEIIRITTKLIATDKEPEPFRYPPVTAEPKQNKTYFSSSTRIVPLKQTNSVAIFGVYESVQRVKDFIQKYLDKSVDTEKTVIHIKPLKYLDADKFAEPLQKFCQQGGGQSKGKGDDILSSVIVKAEKMVTAAAAETREKLTDIAGVGVTLKGDSEQQPTIGGNNLIIAANQRDWKILGKLIDDLDTSQWQVALDVLIVDIAVQTNKELRAQLRRIARDSQSHEFKWQSAQIAPASLDYTSEPTYPTRMDPSIIDKVAGLEADILSTQPPVTQSGINYNLAAVEDPGATVVTFKDKNGTSAILALLDSYENIKIVARPFIITRNNHSATIIDKTTRWVQGPLETKSMGGPPVVNYTAFEAALHVTMVPRLSRVADNINLQIRVDANEFVGSTDVVTQRTVVTNANVANKEVLVLGGISRSVTEESVKGTPVLSRIPLIGHLFKNQAFDYEDRNLVIFVCPTRISPTEQQASKVPSQFTQNKLTEISNKFSDYAAQFECGCLEPGASDENFHCLKDPITNFIFPYHGSDFKRLIDEYAKKDVWSKEAHAKRTKELEAKISTSQKDLPTQKTADKLKEVLKDEQNPLAKK